MVTRHVMHLLRLTDMLLILRGGNPVVKAVKPFMEIQRAHASHLAEQGTYNVNEYLSF